MNYKAPLQRIFPSIDCDEFVVKVWSLFWLELRSDAAAAAERLNYSEVIIGRNCGSDKTGGAAGDVVMSYLHVFSLVSL